MRSSGVTSSTRFNEAIAITLAAALSRLFELTSDFSTIALGDAAATIEILRQLSGGLPPELSKAVDAELAAIANDLDALQGTLNFMDLAAKSLKKPSATVKELIDLTLADTAKLGDLRNGGKAPFGKHVQTIQNIEARILELPAVVHRYLDGFGRQNLQGVRNLNLGALPVPIKLVSTGTIGATLGEATIKDGLKAALIGFALIALFMILWYRLPGVAAGVVALGLYLTLTLTIFKLAGVTITAAGIAGLILSLGIAVDANILIFERLKEELRKQDDFGLALKEAFHRASTPSATPIFPPLSRR